VLFPKCRELFPVAGRRWISEQPLDFAEARERLGETVAETQVVFAYF